MLIILRLKSYVNYSETEKLC